MEKYFNGVALKMISNEDNFNKLRSWGVSGSDFPACEGKRVLARFDDILSTGKSHGFAFDSLLTEIDKLGYLDLPDVESDFWPDYRKEVDKVRALALASAIKSNPGQINAALANFYTQGKGHTRVMDLGDEIDGIIEAHEKDLEQGKVIEEIEGYPILSKMIGGFNKQRISMLVAKSGFGKTNLGVNLCLNASKNSKTIYINMEMGKRDFAARFVLAASDISYQQWNYKDQYIASKGEINKGIKDVLKKRSIKFTDGKKVSVENLRSILISEKKQNGLDMVFVDYDQKLDLKISHDTPEWKALLFAIEELEEMAKQLDIHIVVFGQGNDEGIPKASARAVQPLATLLSFFKDEVTGGDYIKANKNRFGKSGVTLKMNYEPAKNKCDELQIVDLEVERESIEEQNNPSGRFNLGSYQARR